MHRVIAFRVRETRAPSLSKLRLKARAVIADSEDERLIELVAYWGDLAPSLRENLLKLVDKHNARIDPKTR